MAGINDEPMEPVDSNAQDLIFVPFTPYITKWIRFFMMFHLNGFDANQPSHLTHLTLCDCRLSATMELPGGSDNEVLGDRAALCPFFLAGKNILKTWWATPKEKPFQSKNLSCKRVCRFWVKGRSKSKPLTLKYQHVPVKSTMVALAQLC